MTSAVRDAAATAGAAMNESDVGAGAGSAACAEAMAIRDDATTAAAAMILSFIVASICKLSF
jgi:hypothetical protein